MHTVVLILSTLPSAPPSEAPPVESRARISELVASLRSDGVRWNCVNAIDALAALDCDVVPELEAALDSDDLQQRLCAASLLRRVDDYAPSHRFLQVCVEGLRDDDLPFDGDSYTDVFDAAGSARFLTGHAMVSEAYLLQALESDDLQQRFLAAVVLGWSGRAKAIDRALPILLPHLRDNQIPSDAVLAGGAIYRFGNAVLPLLRTARESAVDAQQAGWLHLIVLDLQDPPKSLDEIWSRRLSHNLDSASDPLVCYDLSSICFCFGKMTEARRDTSSPRKTAD